MKITFDPWVVSAGGFPSEGSWPEKWSFLLRYAVLAPSSHNSQPWLFHLRQNQLELHADRRRACRVVDPDDRELIMSCGCALFHLRCAMRHFGCLGPVEILPDRANSDLIARVALGDEGESGAEETRTFEAIPLRRTNRQRFDERPVPPGTSEALAAAAEAEGAWLRVVSDEESRNAIAELISEGDRRQWANKAFRLELSRWVHSNRSPVRDGIPGYAQGIDDLLSYAGPLVVRTFDMGEGQAAHDREVATGSPILTVLGTDGDLPPDWVAAGQALARVLLRARADEVWSSFLNQPIEVSELRQKLRMLIGNVGHPQCVLRFGFSEQVRPTPRRLVEEVLI